MEITVIKVYRDNKKAKRVVIKIGTVSIPFIIKEGEVVEEGGIYKNRTRLDGKEINNLKDLRVPSNDDFHKAISIAAAILKRKRVPK